MIARYTSEIPRWKNNMALVITIITNSIALIVFFVRVDSRLSALEDWKNEILPTRVTIKDIQIIEEKIRNIDSKVTDIKDMVKK
jgi:hypothetical protein|nr:MAG TPA: hypothetical protein [Caudoviricetes sp.]DAX27562.1 MAG TPA: hypothetical protein [Caudoviricetes sp.]